jgi:NADPH:quinone reductase
MSTQNALALTEIAKPLTKIALPIPSASELKENEVLIKITAAGCKSSCPISQCLLLTNL